MEEFRVRILDGSSGVRGSQGEKPNYVNPSLRMWSETLDALEDCVQDDRYLFNVSASPALGTEMLVLPTPFDTL
ncbi:hypothetical protein RRG08_028656 [Elysia crispata]|uniref:Uncharacterized protein n=1 Tax=Elysia crispata TaxID=231223 RepID=A0AAE0ZBS2_9GAST|nr:hypothetical protein RRG08_028656 [Elysia crispata]